MVVARYNEDVTKRLLRGALALSEIGQHDAITCLACVIQDHTLQFEVIATRTAMGLMQVQLDTGVPITLGVINAEGKDQALARSGPKNNKGAEAAEAAIEMANLLVEIQG